MEQYLEGTEYFVNGQVDSLGRVHVVAIFEYVRLPANGRHNIDAETLPVQYRDPRFAALAGYAQQVVRATELRRSPFHLELKAGPAGPCLIEVGARLAGHGNAFLNELLHGSRLDLFGLAAHYYFKADDYGTIPLDWNAYDASAFRYVHGVADQQTRIYRLEGVQEVEALPEFHQWVKQPRLGMPLEPTCDMLSMPYSLLLKGHSQEHLALTASRVREILKLNRSVGMARRAIVSTTARVRLASLAGAPEGVIEPIARGVSLRGMARRSRELVAHALGRTVRKVQLLEIGRAGSSSAYSAAPDSAARSDAIVQWARQYLGRPHARLGRPGAICPFVRKTIDLDRFLVKFYDDVDGTDLPALRGLVLQESRSFRKAYPRSAADGVFSSVVLVFPHLRQVNCIVLDQLHDELKTHLIAKHELMSSPFHPRSVKPSVTNAEFPVFRAPLPMLAIRHLDVRDITFVGTNERAFKRYRATFAEQFERGEVSNEFGHVSAYTEACKRFGFGEPRSQPLLSPPERNATGIS
jgi:heptaprenyl diphosphate synthase